MALAVRFAISRDEVVVRMLSAVLPMLEIPIQLNKKHISIKVHTLSLSIRYD